MTRVLPQPGTFDTVNTKVLVKRQGLFGRLYCAKRLGHPTIVPYDRIDYRAGPGSFADNFEGRVCALCGTIIEERQTL